MKEYVECNRCNTQYSISVFNNTGECPKCKACPDCKCCPCYKENCYNCPKNGRQTNETVDEYKDRIGLFGKSRIIDRIC